jgi:hypothetical protein
LFLFLLCPVIGPFVTLPCVPCMRLFDTLHSIVLQENCYYSSSCPGLDALFRAYITHWPIWKIMLCHIHSSDWSLLSLLSVPFPPTFSAWFTFPRRWKHHVITQECIAWRYHVRLLIQMACRN